MEWIAVGAASLENFGGAGDDIAQDLGRVLAGRRLGAWQVFRDGVAAVVVGLVASDGRAGEGGTMEEQEVAVAYAGVEANIFAGVTGPAVRDFGVEKVDGLMLLVCTDMAAGEVGKGAVWRDGDEVHAEDDVIGSHLDSLRGGLQRAAPAKLRGEVAAEDGHVRDIAGCRVAVGEG